MQPASSGSRAFLSRSALPSEWDRRHYGRHQHVQDYLKVDGLTVKYVGPGELDSQAATIIADKPVPQDVPMYYFEVSIVNKGDNGYIGVGFCTDTVNLGRLPGWEPHSYGYHGDDGHAFHGSGQGRPFGPGFSSGDVIGALLDRSRKTISYFKNGKSVGVAFYDVQEHQLYPCVGMRTKHEEVKANFGGAPFCVDLNLLQAAFRERLMDDISATQLPSLIQVPMPARSSPPKAAAAADADADAAPCSTPELEAAAAACADAIRALDSNSSAALANLETATQTYLAALEAAAAMAGHGSSAQAGGDSTNLQPASTVCNVLPQTDHGRGSTTAGRASQPLLLYYIFDYLLHRRCWKTAAVIAKEMLAACSNGHSNGTALPGAHDAAAGASTAALTQQIVNEVGEDDVMTDVSEPAAAAAKPNAADTVAASTVQTGAFSGLDVQDALRRQKISDAICAGQIAEALSMVHAQYGQQVLQQNQHLHFKLRVQQFVELVRQACKQGAQQHQEASVHDSNGVQAAGTTCNGNGFEAALAFGRSELGPRLSSAQDDELLSDALSLLAYVDPAASPCGHLMRESYRAELAEALNGALLKARGRSCKPLLESAYRQTVVLVEELKRCSLPGALVLDVPSLCSGTVGRCCGSGSAEAGVGP